MKMLLVLARVQEPLLMKRLQAVEMDCGISCTLIRLAHCGAKLSVLATAAVIS